jgi:hypothetical protein
MDEDDGYDEIDDIQITLPTASPEQLEKGKKCRELRRLFVETNWAIQCLKIVGEIEKTCSELREGFLVFAYRSLWNDALASLMRVFDETRDAFSLWKIDKLDGVCQAAEIDIATLREFSARLRTARSKAHFHIDKKYAADPDELWAEVNIKESEMLQAANNAAKILSHLLSTDYLFPANLSRYDASDVRPILQHLHTRGLGNMQFR